MKHGESLFGAAVTLTGLFFAVHTWALPDAPGYSQVSPRLFPALVSAELMLAGVLLAWQALRGGFRAMPEEERGPPELRAVGWISLGVLAHMTLIGVLGFIIASTLLFGCVARGVGSKSVARDAIVGLLLACTLYFIFTQGLGLSLGPMPGFGGDGK